MTGNKINLIFDCDGTLVDSYPAIIDSIAQLFRLYGIDCEDEEIREPALYNNVTYCITTLSAKYNLEPDMVLKDFQKIEENIELMRLFSNEEKVLADERFRCFVFTHRGTSTGRILARFGIEKYFEEIVDSTYHFKRKPDSEGIDYLVKKYMMDKTKTSPLSRSVVPLSRNIWQMYSANSVRKGRCFVLGCVAWNTKRGDSYEEGNNRSAVSCDVRIVGRLHCPKR